MHMATPVQSIRTIVASSPSAAAILEQFDINLCKQGESSLQQACAQLQLSVDQVLEKLEAAERVATGAVEFEPASMSLTRLIQHIVRTHHVYVRHELPRLEQLAQKIESKHSGSLPAISRIAEILTELRIDMFAHLEKEEGVLFPFIAQMDQEPLIAYAPPQACFHTVAQPIFMMVQEHELAESLTIELQKLTSNYTAPEWACANLIGFFGSLRALQSDLRQHVH